MAARRQVLKVIGGGVVAAAAGAGAFWGTRTPDVALAPWAQAGAAEGDPRRTVLSWAILAPNPHNRQPWLVDLGGELEFTLYADSERKLPQTDPRDRQITIGLGCFLEVARQAATAAGFGLRITPFPQGEPGAILDQRPVARVELLRGAMTPDPLFRHVPDRRSCKEPFDMSRPVTADALASLASAVEARAEAGVELGSTATPDEVSALRDLAWRAHEVEALTKRTLMESVDLMRIGRAEIEANPDGIDLGGPFLETLSVLGMLDREQLGDPSSHAFKQGMDMYQALFAATPAFVWLSTPGNTRVEQLATGASWVRLNLAATGLGLSLHPVSQSLQEYPEMAPLLSEVHTALAPGGGRRLQMLGRLGVGPSVAPSPRWPLARRLVAA